MQNCGSDLCDFGYGNCADYTDAIGFRRTDLRYSLYDMDDRDRHLEIFMQDLYRLIDECDASIDNDVVNNPDYHSFR